MSWKLENMYILTLRDSKSALIIEFAFYFFLIEEIHSSR